MKKTSETLKNRAISALRYLERYTKTDMVYLAKGGFWGGVSQVTLSCMTFALAVAFAHLVPKETYGQYKYVLSIVSLLGTLTLSGLGVAVLQSVSNGYEGTIRYAFWQNIRWSVFFFLGSGLISIYYFLEGNTSIGISMLIIGSLWPFFNSTNLYSSLLVAKKDFRRITLYFDILGNLIPYLALFITMFLTVNPLWFVTVYIVSNTLIGILLYKHVTSLYHLNNSIDPDMLGYSKHLSTIGILNSIADNLDQILVFHYIGAAQLAVYNFATAIPDQIKGPIKSITNLMFPRFAKREDEDIQAGINNKMFILFTTGLVISLVYIFLAPYIYKIFFPKYIDSVFYSQIFSLSIVTFASIPANTYLSVKKKIRELYILNTSTSIVQIFIVSASIIKWGILGLIIARVLIRTLYGMTSIILYKVTMQKTIYQK